MPPIRRKTKACRDGISRRTFLGAGGLSLLGMGRPDPLSAAQAAAPAVSGSLPNGWGRASAFGRAKAVIVLFLYGAPSQLDTLDPKPDAPLEVRGAFQTIATSLPG